MVAGGRKKERWNKSCRRNDVVPPFDSTQKRVFSWSRRYRSQPTTMHRRDISTHRYTISTQFDDYNRGRLVYVGRCIIIVKTITTIIITTTITIIFVVIE